MAGPALVLHACQPTTSSGGLQQHNSSNLRAQWLSSAGGKETPSASRALMFDIYRNTYTYAAKPPVLSHIKVLSTPSLVNIPRQLEHRPLVCCVVPDICCSVMLRLAQDPNSEHLGTTVWDASIVLAKYFEKVCVQWHCFGGCFAP